MSDLLEKSLKAAPIVNRGEYNYFIHPITDGVPYLEPALLNEVTDRIMAVAKTSFDKILTIEAMGIHIGTALALRTGKPLSIVRKRPYELLNEVKIHQATGYSKGELYLNGISAGERLIIIDDVVSTGGRRDAGSCMAGCGDSGWNYRGYRSSYRAGRWCQAAQAGGFACEDPGKGRCWSRRCGDIRIIYLSQP